MCASLSSSPAARLAGAGLPDAASNAAPHAPAPGAALGTAPGARLPDLVFAHSPDAIFVESLDGRVLEVNPAACVLHGLSREALLACTVADLVAPGAVDDSLDAFARLARGEIDCLEGESRHADGHCIPVEVRAARVEFRGEPALLMHVRDVSARRRAEGALRRSETRFERAFALAPVPTLLTQLEDGRILDANEAFEALIGRARTDLVGRTTTALDLFVEPADRTTLLRWIEEAGRLASKEVQMRDARGQVRTMLLSAAIVDIDDQPCVLAMYEDLTDRRRLEREVLEIGDREKQRIGRDLHDGLGSHLTGLSLMTRRLALDAERAGAASSAALAEIAELSADAVQQVRRLARGLNPVGDAPTALPAALESLARQTQRVSNVTCLFAGPERVDGLSADAATHLYWIAREAVNNAVKHAGAQRIDVRLETDAHALRLTVRDDGNGLQDNRLDAVEGLGIRIMRYRSGLLGARFGLASHAAGGLQLTCAYPLPPQAPPSSRRTDSDA